VIAYALGAIGYALGLALSAIFDLPSGAIVVCALAGTGLVYVLVPVSPRP
jgi:zinc/manganese transport system permease protein